MKLLVEIVLSVLLHPVALVLMFIDLTKRQDLSTTTKVAWGLVAFIWGAGPILYVLAGRGQFWE